MLFTDLQLWMELSVNDTVYALMDELVEEGKPDMIVLLGDNVSGLFTNALTETLVAKMESYGIPWAPVFGNHDTEGLMTLEDLNSSTRRARVWLSSLFHSCSGARRSPWARNAASTNGCLPLLKFR